MARARLDDNFEKAMLAENDTTNIAEPVLKNNTSDGVYVHVVGNDVPGALVSSDYDYISVAYTNTTTETYTYKTGGASGDTVATVVVVYTDDTKANISSVTRT
jgi:hypothetical protein